MYVHLKLPWCTIIRGQERIYVTTVVQINLITKHTFGRNRNITSAQISGEENSWPHIIGLNAR